MFLHLGAEQQVLVNEILVILNIDKLKKCKISREFIEKSIATHLNINEMNQNSKSIILVQSSSGVNIYFSPINSKTLEKRCYKRKITINSRR